MHSRTQSTLREFDGVEWFVNVGVRDTKVAKIVSTWFDAIESCTSSEWEDVCLEASNQYCARLAEVSPDRFAKWNEIARSLRPVVAELVQRKTQAVVGANGLPKE